MQRILKNKPNPVTEDIVCIGWLHLRKSAFAQNLSMLRATSDGGTCGDLVLF